MSKMFPFITRTENPCKGCEYNCIYCWARPFAETRLKAMHGRYQDGFHPVFFGTPKKNYHPGDFIFMCDMGDMFGPWFTDEQIQSVLNYIAGYPKTTFLLLTKNPSRYLELELPHNCRAGATIESNNNYPKLSRAPPQTDRLEAMKELGHPHKFICIEPCLAFETYPFFERLVEIDSLERVAIGYDNYDHHLPEPSLDNTLKLIDLLEGAGIDVIRKTLRKAAP